MSRRSRVRAPPGPIISASLGPFCYTLRIGLTLDHNKPKSNKAADSYAFRPIQKAENLLYRIFFFFLAFSIIFETF